jgi:hypothetical protein
MRRSWGRATPVPRLVVNPLDPMGVRPRRARHSRSGGRGRLRPCPHRPPDVTSATRAVRQVPAAWAARRSRTNAGSRPAASASDSSSIGRPVEELRQLPQRPRPLHRHRDRLLGPPATGPQLRVERALLTRRDHLQGEGAPDQGLERHAPAGLEVGEGGQGIGARLRG